MEEDNEIDGDIILTILVLGFIVLASIAGIVYGYRAYSDHVGLKPYITECEKNPEELYKETCTLEREDCIRVCAERLREEART